MENFRTPNRMDQVTFNRTPTLRERRNWNTLNVNNINVRCSTPILGDFRSPNLSPIKDMRFPKSPASPMIFMKPTMKLQPPQISRNTLKRTAANFKLPKHLDDTKNSSPEDYSDDSVVDTSLAKESRRRSINASNHSYVVNHASNVKEILLRLGLAKYMDNFEKAHIDLVELVSMERSDLLKIGLRSEDCSSILNVLKGI